MGDGEFAGYVTGVMAKSICDGERAVLRTYLGITHYWNIFPGKGESSEEWCSELELGNEGLGF